MIFILGQQVVDCILVRIHGKYTAHLMLDSSLHD